MNLSAKSPILLGSALCALALILATGCANNGEPIATAPSTTSSTRSEEPLPPPSFDLPGNQPPANSDSPTDAHNAPTHHQPPNNGASPTTPIATALESALKAGKKSQIDGIVIDGALLKSLYAPRAYAPFFIDAKGHQPLADVIKQVLTEISTKNGLREQDYWNQAIDTRFNPTNAVAAESNTADLQPNLELELLLAESTVTLASDLSTGRLDPKISTQNIIDLELGKRAFKDFSTLAAMLEQPAQLADRFNSFAPHHAMYTALANELAVLLNAQNNGGWPNLGNVKKLSPGQKNAIVPAIRVRLVDLGTMTDTSQRSNQSTVYDPALAGAVRSFQDGAKLNADAVIGHTTLAALQIPLAARIDQVRANMEKWRLLPVDLGRTYIFVSLGAQQFELFDGDSEDAATQPKLAFRTVVGQETRETPSFIDEISDVIINPYWTSPADIIVKDVLPKAVNNSGYWRELHMRVFDHGHEIDPANVDWGQYNLDHLPPYEFREDSGPENSLGQIKFNLSQNSHSIYMHDTNHRELFAQPSRLYSSGCIRLQKPLDLATYLLTPQGIDQNEITGLINDSTVVAHQIRLRTQMRVYIVDTTIFFDRATGGLQFGPNVYKMDTRIVDALNGTPSTEPPTSIHNGAP